MRVVLAGATDGERQDCYDSCDATAADIYSKAYAQDPEFYSFYRSINAYRSSIGQPGDIMVISPDNEFFRYLNNSRGTE